MPRGGGLGGADAFRGGAGDDWFSVGDLDFRKVDGGGGFDLLHFEGGEQTIDFTAIANNRVVGIEQLSTSDGNADTMRIGALDMLDFSGTPFAEFTSAVSKKQLLIFGDAGDTVQLVNFDPGSGGTYHWDLVASDRNLADSASGDFDLYNLVRDSKVLASIAIADMDVVVA